MSFVPVQIVGRVERRRRYTTEQKLAVVAEATAPGASISEVARRHDLLPSQVFKWRRLVELGVIGLKGTSELPSLVAAEVVAPAGMGLATADLSDDAAGRPAPDPSIEVVVGTDVRVRIAGAPDPATLAATLDMVLRDRRR
jgi:transposase